MNKNLCLENLERFLEYHFSDIQLLEVALTHSSFSNESKRLGKHNERLEFLGDSVLNIIISDYLYRSYPNLPEGKLTKVRAGVVSESSLAEAAKAIRLGDYLKLGKGEEISGGRQRISILADAFEALIGAMYLDGGMEIARGFIMKCLSAHIQKAISGKSYRDYKTELQELLQKDSSIEINYTVTDEEGPDHDKTFRVEVKAGGKVLGRGSGKSKKEAEQDAAENALVFLQSEK